MVFVLIEIVSSREPPSPCKNLSLIDDGTCDLINFNENCKFDGKDCCPNPTAIGNGHCNTENLIQMCNYDAGDCCSSGDGKCDPNGLHRMCDIKKEWEDCSCDYQNLTRDGICNIANNKSICLFDDYDCLCPDSSLVSGVYVDCTGNILIS